MSSRGTIKKLIPDKKCGFITPEGEQNDIHFNFSALNGTPVEGAAVEFDIHVEGDSRRTAKNISFIGAEGGPAPPRPFAGGYGGASLPPECVFSSFYDAEDCLRQSLFFEAPKKAAELFERENLKRTQYRKIYNWCSYLELRLRRGEISFAQAREKFGAIYAERLERAVKRNVLPGVVKKLFDSHLPIVLAERREMLGFFRYITNILCYTKY